MTVTRAIDLNAGGRDDALTAAIRNTSYAHLIFASGKGEDDRCWIMSGYIHIHGGRLVCCPEEDAVDCRNVRFRTNALFRQGGAEVDDGYEVLDVEHLIQIDLDNMVCVSNEDGRYLPLWHHREYVDFYLDLGKERHTRRPYEVD